jgi:hypothetical protein
MNTVLKQRLDKLENIKLPVINSRMLRGGMQERVQRQEIKRYNNEVEYKKNNIKLKIDKDNSNKKFSISSIEQIENFDMPVFRSIKNINRCF